MELFLENQNLGLHSSEDSLVLKLEHTQQSAIATPKEVQVVHDGFLQESQKD